MNTIRSKLTYANVMATIAIFVALGGASYAAVKLPRNSVGTKQIKKNAVTGAKVRNGSITGRDIKVSTLGMVPSAVVAGSAASAANVEGLYRRTVRAAAPSVPDFQSGLNSTPDAALYTAGPFTIYGKCFVFGGATFGLLYIRTSQAGAVLDGPLDTLDGSTGYLDPGTPADERRLFEQGTLGTLFDADGNSEESNEFSAIAPDGSTLSGTFQVGLKVGTPAHGPGPFGAGNACIFASQGTLNGS